MAGSGGSSISGADFGAVGKALGQFDKVARKELLAGARAAARPILVQARANVMATNASNRSSGGLNSGAGRRTRAQLSSGKSQITERRVRSAQRRSGLRASAARSLRIVARDNGKFWSGVKVKAEGNRMPADQRRLPKRMNRGSWRHPVMGNRHAWVTQVVTPDNWFDRAARDGRGQATRKLSLAVNKAAVQLASAMRRAA